MRLQRSPVAPLFLGICTFAVAACSGSSDDPMNPGGGGAAGSSSGGGTESAAYVVTNLVSDGAAGLTAAHIDHNLINPWGIVFASGAPVWLSNNGTQTSTLYDGSGVPQSLVVTIPPGVAGDADPTGIVAYAGSTDFIVSKGTASASAAFIYDGEGSTISGWSPGVSATTTVTMYDDAAVNPANPAVYKGLAIANTAGGNELFAADFHNNKIDVFNSSFKKVTAPGGFIDPTLPAGYAPFNIQALGNMLYVAYAVQGAQKHDETDGVGLGLVDVFDLNGNLAQHLIPVGGALNAPWGLSMAPSDFGAFSGDLLVGNFGDGRINVYNPVTGTFVAALSDSSGKAIAIPGLWGIAFGNDAVQQPHNALFFTAGPNGEADGLYGRIDLPGNSPAGSSSSGGSGSSSSSSSSSGGTPTPPPPIGY